MRKIVAVLIILAVVTVVSIGGYFLWDRLTRVSRAELQTVVERDGVPHSGTTIPDEILDKMAENQVVILGETHFLREHRELVAELVRELHARGYRQYLFEWT